MRYRRIPEPIAAVGDRVRVIDVKNCTFGYNRNMLMYIGMEAVVTKCRWSSESAEHLYCLDIDNGNYHWCRKCIERIEDVDIEESDADVTDLFV